MAKKRPQQQHRGQNLKPQYNQPDLSEWSLDALDRAIGGLEQFIKAAVSEALTLAMADEDTRVELPAMWGDESVDPLYLRLEIALGLGTDKHPVYTLSLRKELEVVLKYCRQDGSFSDGLMKIKDAFRELADEIEAAIDAGAEESSSSR